eukprot:4326531-Amphidinium_carterae.1
MGGQMALLTPRAQVRLPNSYYSPTGRDCVHTSLLPASQPWPAYELSSIEIPCKPLSQRKPSNHSQLCRDPNLKAVVLSRGFPPSLQLTQQYVIFASAQTGGKLIELSKTVCHFLSAMCEASATAHVPQQGDMGIQGPCQPRAHGWMLGAVTIIYVDKYNISHGIVPNVARGGSKSQPQLVVIEDVL